MRDIYLYVYKYIGSTVVYGMLYTVYMCNFCLYVQGLCFLLYIWVYIVYHGIFIDLYDRIHLSLIHSIHYMINTIVQCSYAIFSVICFTLTTTLIIRPDRVYILCFITRFIHVLFRCI